MVPFFRLANTNEEEEPSLLANSIKEEIEHHTSKDPTLANDPNLVLRGKLLYTKTGQIIVPSTPDQALRMRILKNFHDATTAGHLGRDRTELIIKKWCFWPDMTAMISEYVRTCELCQRTKPDHHAPFVDLASIPIPDKPWTSVAMDFIVDLPKSTSVEGFNMTRFWSLIDSRRWHTSPPARKA